MYLTPPPRNVVLPEANAPKPTAPSDAVARQLRARLPVLPFCAGAMVRTTEQDGSQWHLFDARDVARFFAKQKYSCFFFADAQGAHEHLLVDSLSMLERRLRGFGFVRVHRSELVNLRFLRRLCINRRHGTAHVELADGQRAEVSRRRLGQLRDQLRRLSRALRLGGEGQGQLHALGA